MPLPVFLGDLIEPDAGLRYSVEVRIRGDPNFLGAGDKRTSQRIHQPKVGHIQRAADTVKPTRPAFAIL